MRFLPLAQEPDSELDRDSFLLKDCSLSLSLSLSP